MVRGLFAHDFVLSFLEADLEGKRGIYHPSSSIPHSWFSTTHQCVYQCSGNGNDKWRVASGGNGEN
ncbi:unnamed protein product [Ceratitis capitata]|uniref:(Mediterranean fruit fly) hypothetical protein n=1 Tax=Ceratitis capitata TaxID=7213 RepID=A0A811UB01_CERCA|nr:unnamed protein product [Ceratitis capitata]